nr:AAA family ATPase [Kitasatospora cineracea]
MALQADRIEGGVHVSVHAPAQLPVPHQLPPAPAHLPGRRSELAALERALGADRPAGSLLVLNGPAGVGKSALAVNWLRAHRDRFPDGAFYADLRGHSYGDPADPIEALGRFLRALGHTAVPAELAEASALWRSATARMRIAVLLDSAVGAAQVRPLLPTAAAAVTLVTSRTRLTGLAMDGAEFLTVGLVGPDAANAILAQQVGAERIAAERSAADQVVTRCAGLPLAICVAGARMAARPQQPLAATAEALRREGDRLTALRLDGEAAVRGVLDASYRALEPAAARLYRLLGLLPVPEFTPEATGAAGELSRDGADCLLDALAGVHLLEERAAGRYRFHDLVRLHARERGTAEEPPEQGGAAVRRVAEHYLAAATAAEALVMPSHRLLPRDYLQPPLHEPEFAEESEALDWFERERDQLAAVLRDGSRNRQYGLVWQLADAMQPMFIRLRPHALQLEAHALGLDAARKSGDRIAEQWMLTSGGQGLRSAGRIRESADWYARALEVSRANGDVLAEAQSWTGLGHAHRILGELDSARAQFEAALHLRESLGYRRGVGLVRVALGEVAVDAADEAGAVRHLSAAVADLTAADDPYEVSRARAVRARAHLLAGRYEEARADLEAARAGFVAAGSAHWQARTDEGLGELALAQGDLAAARELFDTAHRAYQRLAAPDTARLARRLESLPPEASPPEASPPAASQPEASPSDASQPAVEGS